MLDASCCAGIFMVASGGHRHAQQQSSKGTGRFRLAILRGNGVGSLIECHYKVQLCRHSVTPRHLNVLPLNGTLRPPAVCRGRAQM